MVFVTERDTGIFLSVISAQRVSYFAVGIRILRAMHSEGLDIKINTLALGCQAGGNIDVSAGISATKGNYWNSSSGNR